MHIFWWAIEHLDEDFQRGGYVSPKSQNRRNSGLLVPALLTITAVKLVVTQQAARRAGPPRSPLRIVAAQKRQRTSACAQIIWTIPFNDCLNNSPGRHHASRVQYDLTLRYAIPSRSFYARSKGWSFYTTKTHLCHPQPILLWCTTDHMMW